MNRATPPPALLGVLYCDCGPTTRPRTGTRWPSPDEIAQGVRRGVARLSNPPEWIALSGPGDPTRHPRFGVVIDRVLTARDALAQSAGVAILSDSPSLTAPSIGEALERVEAPTFEAWCRLVVQAAPDRVQIYSLGRVPRERLEELARTLRDALSGIIVEVY